MSSMRSVFTAVGILGLSVSIVHTLPVHAQAEATQKLKSGGANKGGQVLESGPYHLEFVPEVSADKTHLDFYLQNGSNHQPIPNAKVIAEIRMPDGTQKRLPLTYDAKDKHYTAILPGKAAGEYKVIILSDINGKKVNGRFSFKR
jgi:hypothetical protein